MQGRGRIHCSFLVRILDTPALPFVPYLLIEQSLVPNLSGKVQIAMRNVEFAGVKRAARHKDAMALNGTRCSVLVTDRSNPG